MIGTCPATIDPQALARDVLASADCLIAGQVQQGYASLLAPGGTFTTALTTLLVIYVAVFGYRLMLGLSSLTLAEVVPHFVKIGIVVALATSWPSYQTLVFDTLFHGPEQLAGVIVRQAAGGATTGGDVLGALQEVFTRLTDAAGDAWDQTPVPTATPAAPTTAVPVVPGTPPAPPPPATVRLPQLGAPQFVAAMLWLSALVLIAASVGVLLVVRIVLALLLLLGPVFVAFALFRGTRGLAEGWLRVTVKFALVPLFALPLIAVAVAVLAPLAASLDDAPVDSARNSPALLVLLVVAVFAAVITQAARLGGGIAGSIRLPRRPAAAPPVGATVGGTARAPAVPLSPTATSRAETIVRAIDGGNRRIEVGGGAGGSPAIAATRAIAGSALAAPAAFDTGGRLGQGYRRLAVAGSATPALSRPRS